MILPKHDHGLVLKAEFARLISAPAWVCLLLIVSTLIVFWPATHYDFLNYDDPDYFTSNPHVLSGLTPANVAWAFTTGHASNWHPLTWLSLMLDAQIGGGNPFGPHLTNLFFHAVNAALLFLLFWKSTVALWRSAFVAALFALHPLHVESVAWISERKDVLSTFFALLALLSYGHYAKEKCRRSFGFALFFFALGLMAKPMLVTLPFVMLLLDWWPLQRTSSLRRLFFEKTPFFLLSVVSCVITFIAQKEGGAVIALVKIPMAERIENAFVSYARYLGKTLWPDALATPYPHPGHWEMSFVIFSVALVTGLTAIAILSVRKFPFVFSGWFWFAGTLVPVIGLVQVGAQAMADRYSYLPLVGIFVIFAWGGAAACAAWKIPTRLVVLLSLLVLTVCAARTRDQLGFWQNGQTLFTHALAVTKNNYVAAVNLGTWYSKNGRMQETLDNYYLALKMNVDDPDVLYDVGNAFAKLGNWDEAIRGYQRALEFAPDQPDILGNLGFALSANKQYAEAAACFEQSLKLNPDSAATHNNFATLLYFEHRFDEAAQQYREAIRLSPDDPHLYANLGDALIKQGQSAEAAQNYQTALRINPGDGRTRAKLQALNVPGSN
jgi:protein O-mannosyl-transferase